MSKINAQHMAILYNGYDISGRTRQFDFEIAFEEDDTTAFQDNAVNSEAGWPSFAANVVSFFDPASNQSWDALGSPAATDAQLLMFLFGEGATPDEGNTGLAAMVRQFKCNTPLPLKGKLTLEATFKGAGYEADIGTVLDYATITDTKTGDTVDMASSNADGIIGYVMVFTPAAVDSYEFKIQDSADDVSWVDYMTFAADGQSRTGERKTSSDAIDRYWRIIATRTGAAGNDLGFAVVVKKQ